MIFLFNIGDFQIPCCAMNFAWIMSSVKKPVSENCLGSEMIIWDMNRKYKKQSLETQKIKSKPVSMVNQTHRDPFLNPKK